MLTPDTLEFVLVAMEGPDPYSQAGGLGVRARELCRATAALGYRTTHIFVGDPDLPAEERDGCLRLVRWCQDVSRRHPQGVYQGEDEKVAELETTLPLHIAERVVGPAVGSGRQVALLSEEWQTARLTELISGALHVRGLRRHCAMLWNANNQYGFHRINWGGLSYVSTVTTVSRYMKHLMWPVGVNAMVIPNGIPEQALEPVDRAAVRQLARAAGTPCLAFKIGRFTPDKGWIQAVDAIAELRATGVPARLLMRGGIEPHGEDVMRRCREHGLEIAEHYPTVTDAADVAGALRDSAGAAVVNLRTFLSDAVVRQIYAAATAVLANSAHEPFGLVGLETMAAGGLPVVGNTGEEYARPYGNALVVETRDAVEVASALRGVVERPDLARRLRASGRRDAADYAWPRVVDSLLERLRYVCEHQGVVPAA